MTALNDTHWTFYKRITNKMGFQWPHCNSVILVVLKVHAIILLFLDLFSGMPGRNTITF